MLGCVEVLDIAPLVYQLLLLATKVLSICISLTHHGVLQGHKIMVLTGVISFFNNKHLHQSLSMSQQEE